MFSRYQRPVLYCSAVAATVGVACLVKEWVGGQRYRRDVDARGKVIVITGANQGIGKETAWELARRGAVIYMACRSLDRCEKTREEIVLDTQNKYVYCRKCNLGSIKSIREFVDTFEREQKELHVLINNAGVMRTPNVRTEDGFELQIGVNHFGHFLLTNLLLNKLKNSAPSRVITVSSLSHIRGKINQEDLNSDQSYSPSDAYAQSKLANILFARELARRLNGTGVTSNAVNPGIADTQIIRHMSFYNSWISTIFLKPFIWPFVQSPRQACQTSVMLALEPSLEKVTGKYYSHSVEAKISSAASDDKLADWLWRVSEKWTRLGQ